MLTVQAVPGQEFVEPALRRLGDGPDHTGSTGSWNPWRPGQGIGRGSSSTVEKYCSERGLFDNGRVFRQAAYRLGRKVGANRFAAGDDIDPRDDIHASARYRARLTVALVKRAIERALAA